MYDRATVGGRVGIAELAFAQLAGAEPGSDTSDGPAQPDRQPRNGLDPRWPARCRHLQDAAVGHDLLASDSRVAAHRPRMTPSA